jgi:hypothetical protein
VVIGFTVHNFVGVPTKFVFITDVVGIRLKLRYTFSEVLFSIAVPYLFFFLDHIVCLSTNFLVYVIIIIGYYNIWNDLTGVQIKSSSSWLFDERRAKKRGQMSVVFCVCNAIFDLTFHFLWNDNKSTAFISKQI